MNNVIIFVKTLKGLLYNDHSIYGISFPKMNYARMPSQHLLLPTLHHEAAVPINQPQYGNQRLLLPFIGVFKIWGTGCFREPSGPDLPHVFLHPWSKFEVSVTTLSEVMAR